MAGSFSFLRRIAGTKDAPKATVVTPSSDRPPGLVVWIHVSREEDLPAIYDVVASFDEHPDEPWFVVTNHGDAPRDLPINCFHQAFPPNLAEGAETLLDHWKPDAVVWVSDRLIPDVIERMNTRDIPLLLVDTGGGMSVARQKFRWPGTKRTALQSFNYILAGDAATAKALIRAGARKSQVSISGIIERTFPALPCNEAERDEFSAFLSNRPVWLAAGVTLSEASVIIEAQELAVRRTHRLLLILVPKDQSDTDEICGLLDAKNLNYELRADTTEPDKETQVYIADTDEEMGLWYRLSPVSYIGGTGRGVTEPGPSPFGAAALGSAVLHGPVTRFHQNHYDRLTRNNAAIQVASKDDLSFAVNSLGSPDRAAELAHAAWAVCSAGAEAADRVHGLLSVALERRKDRE